MFMRGVCTVAVHAQAVQHRHVKRRRKIAVRCAADGTFSELKSKLRGDLTGVVIEFDHVCGAFERATIDPAFDRETDALIERLEGAHQVLDAACLRHLAEANVDLNLSLRGHHIAARTAANYSDVEVSALR